MNEKQVFENAEKNLNFFNDNFSQFEMKFPNQFVAVSGAILVAVGETPDAVMEKVDEKKINREDLLVEFIPIPGSILAL